MNARADDQPRLLNILEQTNGACRKNELNCARTECRYHVADAQRDMWDPIDVCALAYADLGGMPSLDVALLLDLKRSTQHKVEQRALARMRAQWIKMYELETWEQWCAYLESL